MIFVDSSVWIDYFRGIGGAQTDLLDASLDQDKLVTGDLVLVEVLQGYDSERDVRTALRLLSAFPIVTVGGEAVALNAAQNFRMLRRRGITIRKTIDTLIASYCIIEGHSLLYSDGDFDPFVRHLGLISAMSVPGGG